MQFFEKVKEFVQSFMTISLGVRIVLGALLGALGTSTLIGFLAELGAVNYALAYGARLPTEGVPYLRYAATAISLATFATALLTLFVLNVFIRAAIAQFMSSPLTATTEDWASIATMPIRRYLLKGALPAVAATMGVSQLFFLWMPLTTPQWVYPVFSSIFAVTILVLARKPQWAKWFLLSMFMLSMGAFFAAAFTPMLYGKVLNFSRLGGGIEVRLQLNCENKTPCSPEIAGNLFLRTTESFLLQDAKTLEYREIPARLVDSVRYFGAERWGTK